MALLVAKVTVTELSDDREPGTAIVYWVILSSDHVACLVALPEWNLANSASGYQEPKPTRSHLRCVFMLSDWYQFVPA